METLKQQLTQFTGGDEKTLNEKFYSLATYFLSGGYIDVYNIYRIYLKTVEFYFHSEVDGVKDPIVYHRNNKTVQGEVPYFPPITFHAHASGFDIAFENEKMQFRASALIRAYEIKDVRTQQFLRYNTQIGQFTPCKEPFTNTQSTYLYSILNGFGDVGEIKWVDDLQKNINIPNGKPRKGIFVSQSCDQYLPDKSHKVADPRPWSFTRVNTIIYK